MSMLTMWGFLALSFVGLAHLTAEDVTTAQGIATCVQVVIDDGIDI